MRFVFLVLCFVFVCTVLVWCLFVLEIVCMLLFVDMDLFALPRGNLVMWVLVCG